VDNGGKDFVSIKSIREGFDGSVGIAGHESEKYDLEAEHVMYNNSTIEDLYSKVDDLMKTLNIDKAEKVIVPQFPDLGTISTGKSTVEMNNL